MEVVRDVVDREEERDVAESVLVYGLRECAGEGSAPFVAEDGVEFDAGRDGVADCRRGEEGEPEVVVTVRDAVRGPYT
jgi:hypothetical protein